MRQHVQRLLLLLTMTFVATAGLAQDALDRLRLFRTAPGDRAVDAAGKEDEFEIEATTDNTNATIKATRTVSLGKFFKTAQFSASAPLNKSGGATDVATWTAFPNAFTAKAKLTVHWARGRTAMLSGAALDRAEELCKAMRVAAERQGKTATEAAALKCETGNMETFAPMAVRAEFEPLFWDASKAHLIFGGTATGGHSVFEYFQESDLAKKNATRTPWGASVFGAILPPSALTLFTAGFEYRSKYKAADAETRCPASSGSDPTKCKTGAFALPGKTTQKLLTAEMRRSIGTKAMSLKVGYDFESDEWSGDLPIYLVSSSSGALNGGIRAGYQDGKPWQFGVFVSSSFTLSP
jgi:hypothetical protein